MTIFGLTLPQWLTWLDLTGTILAHYNQPIA